MTSLSTAVKAHLKIILTGRYLAPAENSSLSFQAIETRTLSLFSKLGQTIFFSPWRLSGSVFLTRHESDHGLQRSLILSPCWGTTQFTYLGAVLDGVLIWNSAWMHSQHHPFWKFLSLQLYNDSHILTDDFTSLLPLSLSHCFSTAFIPWQGQAHSPPSDTVFLLSVCINILEDLIRRGSTEQERSIIDYAVSSSLSEWFTSTIAI